MNGGIGAGSKIILSLYISIISSSSNISAIFFLFHHPPSQ